MARDSYTHAQLTVHDEAYPDVVMESRRRALGTVVQRACVASAGVFALLAARRPSDAEAHAPLGDYKCCALAQGTVRWCSPGGSNPAEPFWCDHGGFKRTWYCCSSGTIVGCGECQSKSGTCYAGPIYNCSFGWTPGGPC